PAPRGEIGVHHDYGGGAVRELRRVARGRGAAGKDGLERREPRERGVGTRSLVAIERDFLVLALPGRLVRHLHRRREGDDLRRELSRRGRRGHALLALDDVAVQRLAADAVLVGDEIGRLVHGPPHRRHALLQRLVEEAIHVQGELDQADAPDAAADRDARLARGYAIGDDGGGGEARAAVPVDGRAGDRVAETGLQRGVARDVVAGRALRQAAAEDDIFDLGRVDARPLDDLPQD